MLRRLRPVIGCLALCIVPATVGAERELTPADWVRLEKGEIIIETTRNVGGGSSAWSVGLIDQPPELVWWAICSPQLFEKYFKSVPRSLLLDESLNKRVVALKGARPEVVEGLFQGFANADWRREPDGRWSVYSYSRARFPWPLKERWVVLRVTSDDQTMIQVWERVEGTIEEDRGTWWVSPAPGGGTLLVNEMSVLVPGAAFKLLGPVALKASVRATHRSLRAMAADLKGATPTCSACPGLPPSR